MSEPITGRVSSPECDEDGWTWATCMNCQRPIKAATRNTWTHEDYDWECPIQTPHAYPAKGTERGSRDA